MINQVGSQQVTLRMPLTESILSTPATPENVDHGISQELDPREGATVTTLLLTPSTSPLIPAISYLVLLLFYARARSQLDYLGG